MCFSLSAFTVEHICESVKKVAEEKSSNGGGQSLNRSAFGSPSALRVDITDLKLGVFQCGDAGRGAAAMT